MTVHLAPLRKLRPSATRRLRKTAGLNLWIGHGAIYVEGG
jgi:hypothetical protein